MTQPNAYVCYFLSNQTRRSYVGITNCLERRLRQHNGLIKGGARATRGKGPWKVEVLATGFRDKRQCLSFEWFMHHLKPRGAYIGSIARRIKCANTILTTFPNKFANVSLSIQ